MNVLSLFDGMSCGRIALERAGIKIDNYYASEIAKPKIKASKNYFPDNIHIGSVTEVNGNDYKGIDLLIAGSPCQGFSIMGKRLNFSDERSGLIMDFFRILEESEAKYFLLENVPMDKQCEIEISRRLGVLPVKINSALVSAQNRKRLYWTNIPGTGNDLFGSEIEQPKDKGIMLKDILQPESDIDEKYYLKKKVLEYVKARILDNEKYCKLNGDKSRVIQEGYNSNWNGTFVCDELFNVYENNHGSGIVRNTEGKAQTILANRGGPGCQSGLYLISDQFINKNQNGAGFKENPETSYTLNTVDRQSLVINLNKLRIRKLTPIECCRLQTVPDDFFNGSGISDNQQYSCLGDGWTVDVIVHILQGLI